MRPLALIFALVATQAFGQVDPWLPLSSDPASGVHVSTHPDYVFVRKPPMTQAEAIDFHRAGRCKMMEPGRGITRPDGEGWIVSSLPGPHRLYAVGGGFRLRDGGNVIDSRPGWPTPIHVDQGGTLYWCPQARVAGRDECGPVPEAFLYDATR